MTMDRQVAQEINKSLLFRVLRFGGHDVDLLDFTGVEHLKWSLYSEES